MKTLNIKLHLCELVYDVQNKTYLTGVSRENGDNQVLTADIRVNDEDENSNQIKRSILSAVGSLFAVFGGYLTSGAKEVSNELRMEETVVICLSMPSNFNESVAESIASSCHNYIVHHAVGEWFSIMKPEEAEMYTTKAVGYLQDIKEAIHRRAIPVRTKSKEKWNIE